ncbi:hypothetical protein QQ020_09330 [Fulvivirgaceae bacterium BMA12]|uniref:Uncharacterized protein n=1 Tax=Agaribacillus aureus TaxID=3051825 RepID=A0ABT8L4S1_9BACT|nr:hypothetical protein [Fulvivirgaceae bacterium BMA12]
MIKKILTLICLSTLSYVATAQHHGNADSLKNEIIKLRTDVNQIQLNLGKSHKQFKKGMILATIGYSVTIAGGLMLGRKNDDLGKALLVTGGAAGMGGTFILLDSFKFLGLAAGKQAPTRKKR